MHVSKSLKMFYESQKPFRNKLLYCSNIWIIINSLQNSPNWIQHTGTFESARSLRNWLYERFAGSQNSCNSLFHTDIFFIHTFRLIAILIQTPTQYYFWMTKIQLCLLWLFNIASVRGSWEARCVAVHVNKSEGRPSSRFRCECCHSLVRVSIKHVLFTLTTPLTPVSHLHSCCCWSRKSNTKVFSTTHHYVCVTDI